MSPSAAHTVALALPRDDLWTLHHALLERLDAELTASDPVAIDPPPLAVYRVFEALEAGDTRVRIADFEAVTDELCHDGACPPWCLDCTHIAAVCQQVTHRCGRHPPSRTLETADD